MAKNIFILLLVSSFALGAFAQSHKSGGRHKNLEYFEKDMFHFGFSLGFNTSNFIVDYDLTSYDSLISLQSNGQAGFNIGLIGSMRFNKLFTLRFTPTLAFAQRNVEYTFAVEPKNINATRIVESTYIMFPLSVKYRSLRQENFAAYILGGANFAFDLSSQFGVNNEVVISEQVLKVQRQNIFGEIGFGTDFFMEFFKFSIELKYSHGLTNIFVDDESFWAKPIKDIRPNMFTVSFLFEG